MNLAQALFSVAANYAQKVGVDFEGKLYTFQDIMVNSYRAASILKVLGIKKTMWLPFNCPSPWSFYFSIWETFPLAA